MKYLIGVAITACLIFGCGARLAGASELIVVSTQDGALAGVKGEVNIFRGVPFANPPVGNFRWCPPQAVVPWQGVKPATAFGPDPMQIGSTRPSSEDCLYLNVWTPDVSPKTALPVMVWVYGGGFTNGSGANPLFDGTSFARKGVVLVTLNYRVGLLGFLAHKQLTSESPNGSSGNYGLLDVVAGLKWVQKNIHAFGGDPQQVTVFGQSAGASSLSVLLTSPLTEGLFSRAILQSPGSMRPLHTLREGEKIGEVLGSDLQHMRSLSGEDVISKNAAVIPRVRSLTRPRALGPIFDGWVIPFPGEAAAFAAGKVRPIDLLIGTNKDEGIGFVENWPIQSIPEYREFLISNFGAQAALAYSHYPVRRVQDIKAALAAMFSDTQYVYGVRGMARGMAGTGAQVYRYYFSRHRNSGEAAPRHADEVPYVFGHLNLESDEHGAATFDAVDAEISAALQDAWVRFAKTGNPNGGSLPQWEKYDSATDPYLEFGDRIRPDSGLRKAKLDFIEAFFSEAKRN